MNTTTIGPRIATTRTMRSFATAFILLLAGTAVHAKQNYNIELVAFKYSRDEYFNSENWPNEWDIPEISEAVNLGDIVGEYRKQIIPLNTGQRSLNAIVNSLEKSSRYEVLTYKAWRQPGYDKDHAVDILIQTGDKYELQPRASVYDERRTSRGNLFLHPGEVTDLGDGAKQPAGPAKASGETEGPLIETYRRISQNSRVDPANRVYELEGSVKVVLSRFLHIYTDLLLMQPVHLEPIEPKTAGRPEPTESAEPRLASARQESVQRYRVTPVGDDGSFTTLQGIQIRQHRRMRSGELHHLDHPLLGVIVKVTPVKE